MRDSAFFMSRCKRLLHYAAGVLHYARQRILHDERKRVDRGEF